MKIKLLKVMSVLFISIFCISSPLYSDCVIGDFTEKLPGSKGQILKHFYGDWLKEAKVCDLGFYYVAVPTNDTDNSYFMWTDDGPFIIFHKDFGFTLFTINKDSNKHEILLNLQDGNRSGSLNRLSYLARNKNGLPLGDVTDFTMDGQPDLKIIPDKNKSLIWFNEKWYELVKQKNQKGIILNQKFNQVEIIEGRWVLKNNS